MEYCINKHHLPNKTANTDWFEVMLNNLLDKVNLYVSIGYPKENALNEALKESCAGSAVILKVKEILSIN